MTGNVSIRPMLMQELGPLMVYRANDEIITERTTGQRLGSFAVPARS